MAVLVDFNGIALGSILGQLNRGEKLSENLVKHIILNNIRMYRVKYPEATWGKLTICTDSKSWRKDVYPQYKANRTASKEKDTKRDWDEIYRLINLTIDDLKSNFPYSIIGVPKAEADDVIGALTAHLTRPMAAEPVVIISADKDFIQLHRLGEVIQYSPMQQKMVKVDSPIKYMFEHLMKGDSGDGVPNVLSPDNAFTDKIRQTPMRKKVIEEWWEDRDRLKEVMPPEAFRNYMRNREMIDLSRTPKNIKDAAINALEDYKYNGRSDILTYLIENKMKMLIECAGEF
jgi:hypothetical protein